MNLQLTGAFMGQMSRNRVIVKYLAVALLLLLMPLLMLGCVTAEQGRRMESRIDALDVRIEEESERHARELAEENARLEARIAELAEALENMGFLARRTSADVGVTLDSLNEEIRGLRGRIDELRHQIDRGLQDQDRFKDTLDRRLAGMEGEEAVAEVEARQVARRAERPEDPEPFLAMAKKRLEDGEYGVARNLILDFQRRWPTHALSGESQHLLAESYFLQKDYRSAILEFNKVRERYPESSFMPMALLRLGQSFAALELKREAGDFFDAVINNYPNDKAAKEAATEKRSLNRR